MKHKYFVILIAVQALLKAQDGFVSVGELARFLNTPKSTIRNRVIWLEERGFLEAEKFDYKSTGKWLVDLTGNGKSWILEQRTMF